MSVLWSLWRSLEGVDRSKSDTEGVEDGGWSRESTSISSQSDSAPPSTEAERDESAEGVFLGDIFCFAPLRKFHGGNGSSGGSSGRAPSRRAASSNARWACGASSRMENRNGDDDASIL